MPWKQSVIKARLKLLTQNFFSAKSFCKCVMDDESYFKVVGNEWQHQSYDESEDHPATEDVKFICKTKFPAKVLLWLSSCQWKRHKRTSVFRSRSCSQQRSVQYISKCLPVLHKCIQKHHKNEKIVLWPDLASAH
jgi:hypothetical protein